MEKKLRHSAQPLRPEYNEMQYCARVAVMTIHSSRQQCKCKMFTVVLQPRRRNAFVLYIFGQRERALTSWMWVESSATVLCDSINYETSDKNICIRRENEQTNSKLHWISTNWKTTFIINNKLTYFMFVVHIYTHERCTGTMLPKRERTQYME